MNKSVMECSYRSKPFHDDGKLIRGYRQRMMQELKNMDSLKSPSNDCVTKQELLEKTVGSLIWNFEIFGG